MNQLLFIETFVLGSAVIAAIYHLVLFIQQRDKFLLFYSLYLFSLSVYIGFKLISNNYDPFLPTDNVWYYILEEVLQVAMVTVYVLFAAQTLEVVQEENIVRSFMYAFFALSAFSICYHVFDAIQNGPGVKSTFEYAFSRISLVGIATIALISAWRIRTTTFQRTIIIGSLVYDSSGLLSIISFTQKTDILGLNGVEPYLAGCLLDIIIFSSALGYRLKTIAVQKNELLIKESQARLAIEHTRTQIAVNLHDDVGSILSSMSIYSEAAKQSVRENNLPRVTELIDKIGISARETMGNMSDIIWTINPINDNGIKLFNKMEDFASPLFHSKQVNFSFQVASELFDVDFPMPVRQHVYFIFKEAINNCIKHAEAQHVKVNIDKIQNDYVMRIEDDGKGFDNEKDYNGNGYKSMKQRASELNGTILFKSANPGTILVLMFKL